MFIELPLENESSKGYSPVLINTNQITYIEEHPFLNNCSRISLASESEWVDVKIAYSNLIQILGGKCLYVEETGW